MKRTLDVLNVSKVYSGTHAVRDLTFKVSEGEVFGLLGPNGAGKTTTIQMLLGLTQPSGGRINVLGFDPSERPLEIRASTGIVMQESALDEYLSAEENLLIYAELFSLSNAQKRSRVKEVLKWVGLAEATTKIVSTLSGGMKRRLDLAISILHHPKILILDEPTLGLDVQTRHQLWEHIRRLQSEGVTVVVTTHYLEEANQLCDRIAIINKGALVAMGSPHELKEQFLGDMHRLEVTLSSADDVNVDNLPNATLEGNVITLRGKSSVLWKVLTQLEADVSNTILKVNYSQPSLDDVFLKLTMSEESERVSL